MMLSTKQMYIYIFYFVYFYSAVIQRGMVYLLLHYIYQTALFSK